MEGFSIIGNKTGTPKRPLSQIQIIYFGVSSRYQYPEDDEYEQEEE